MYDLYVYVKCMFLIQIWIQIDIKSFLEVLEAILSLVQSKQSGSSKKEWSLKYKQTFYPRFWIKLLKQIGCQLAEISAIRFVVRNDLHKFLQQGIGKLIGS